MLGHGYGDQMLVEVAERVRAGRPRDRPRRPRGRRRVRRPAHRSGRATRRPTLAAAVAGTDPRACSAIRSPSTPWRSARRPASASRSTRPDSRDAKGLLAAADAAMYASKRAFPAWPEPRPSSGYLPVVPEGDSLHRAARRLQALVGQRLEAESPHPRAQATGVAQRIDGRVLESVEAVGKNLLLRFEGGVVVRSHLRMSGRWRVEPRGRARAGAAVARAARRELRKACSGTARCSRSRTGAVRRLGPDVLADEFDVDAAVARLRGAGDLSLGEALQSQRLVAGIGNMWMAEALWEVRVSPWVRVRDAERRDAARGAGGGAAADAGVARDAAGRAVASTGVRAGPAAAAARSSARAARATRTAPPTGVPAARQERGRRGSKQDGWPSARPTCI